MAPKPKSSNLGGDAKDDDEAYRLKRDRNNVAVKKSREKSRQKARETSDRISRLREENVELEQRVDDLSNELNLLKKTLLAHVGAGKRKSPPAATPSAASSETNSALADPKIVSQDHEYAGQKTSFSSLLNN